LKNNIIPLISVIGIALIFLYNSIGRSYLKPVPMMAYMGDAASNVQMYDWKWYDSSGIRGKIKYLGGQVNSITEVQYNGDGVKLQENNVSFPSLQNGEIGMAEIVYVVKGTKKIIIHIN
jgi:hypothetical protein